MFEIIKINEDGTREVVGTTDINLASVDATYNLLEAKVSSTLDKFMESRDLDGKDKVTLLASTINNIVNQAMTTTETELKLKLLQAQIDATDSEKAIKEAQSTKDLLLKEKQIAVDTQRIVSMNIDDTVKSSQKLAIDSEKAIKEAQSTKDLLVKEKQLLVSQKQIEGFDKDMFFKAGGMSKELLYMLAQANATEGYEWNADVVKQSIEKMTDGVINLKTVTGDNPNTTTVETSYTKAEYDGDGTPNYGLAN